jgi:hypothetical protein
VVLVVRLYHPLKSIISLMFLRLVWCFRLLVNYLRQVVVLSACELLSLSNSCFLGHILCCMCCYLYVSMIIAVVAFVF